MKISVIIPSYKPQDYLWDCLGSINNQDISKASYEVIIVLNGCKEPYYGYIHSYITRNMAGSNVNLIQTDQGGVSNARNIGIENAKGEYVTFIDDDDYVSENYLQELYNVAKLGLTPIANLRAFDDGSDELYDIYVTDQFKAVENEEFFKMNRVRSYMSSPVAKLLSRSDIGIRRFDNKFSNGEDSLFIFAISNKIGLMKCTSSDAVYYRRYREGSAISKLNRPVVMLRNAFALSFAFFKIWLSNPFSYNFSFFLTRIVAPFKGLRKFF